MGNHIIIRPKVTSVMYVTPDGKYVIHETTITDKRPLRYYTGQLLKNPGKKTVSRRRKTKK